MPKMTFCLLNQLGFRKLSKKLLIVSLFELCEPAQLMTFYCRSCDGTYHFKLVWPELPNNFNEWKQTSDPTTSQVEGYQGLLHTWA
jgi:hypothetical protein